MSPSTIAISLHDVEPATFDVCRQIRAWLLERGIHRATLLVIPAPGGRRLDPGSELAAWLRERRRCGDALAQHGFSHSQLREARPPRQWLARLQGGRAAEFVGLDESQTRQALHDGGGLLRAAGIEARGFVAPAYAYTAALRDLLGLFDWWADLLHVNRLPLREVHGKPLKRLFAPACCLGTSTQLKRLLSPAQVNLTSRLAGNVLRLDVHPADFQYSGHVAALEAVLERERLRAAVTYDDLSVA